jgi:hypothetical protein
VALVTSSFFNATQGHQTKFGAAVIRSFPLPVHTEAITISQMWHPRFDADPAHRWLRGLVLANLPSTAPIDVRQQATFVNQISTDPLVPDCALSCRHTQ